MLGNRTCNVEILNFEKREASARCGRRLFDVGRSIFDVPKMALSAYHAGLTSTRLSRILQNIHWG